MTDPTPGNASSKRDHGGGLDTAIARFGGCRADWIDLSTGINPQPYPLPQLPTQDWTALPDQKAWDNIIVAARRFWRVPDGAAVLPAPGASALIARLPALAPSARVRIERPTYNEHAAAFSNVGWKIVEKGPAEARVLVHPNNPDGRLWNNNDANADLTIIDESFCDILPEASLIGLADRPGCLTLKSFGKFWGHAGLRLGFAIARPELIAPLANMLGPWPVSGPALRIGAAALRDDDWAQQTRARLRGDAARLDKMVRAQGAELVGGTDLYRLYEVPDAIAWQTRLAKRFIWSRVFPYSKRFLRLGLPPENGWSRIAEAL